MKKLLKLLLLLFSTMSLLHANKAEITLAVYPNKDNKVLYEEFKPLLTHLKNSLNKEINFIVAKDYNNQIELLSLNKVDLAILGPYNYIKSKKVNRNIKYLATRQTIIDGVLASSYKSVIVASKNSAIKNLQDLKNKNFGFTDFNSTSGYLFPSFVLKSNHILKSDFKQIYMLKKHSRVMEALTRDSIDAAATYYSNYQTYAKKYGNIYNILYISEEIPYDVIVASPYLKKELTKEIEKALLSFKEKVNGRLIYGYVKKEVSDYDYILKKEAFVK